MREKIKEIIKELKRCVDINETDGDVGGIIVAGEQRRVIKILRNLLKEKK